MIQKDNTHWVLICGMLSEDPELTNPDRHITDIFWAIICLCSRGVEIANIDVLIDARPQVDLSKLTSLNLRVQRLLDYDNVIKNNNLTNLVLVVYGHGNHLGLDGHNKLQPASLMSSIKARDNLAQCIAVFGQCYSGLYNFIDLTCNATICFLGASNLNSSISGLIDVGFQNGTRLKWCGNLFLYHFMRWILDGCHDIDGDSKQSLMDGYKFAGSLASIQLLESKQQALNDIYNDQKSLDIIVYGKKQHMYSTAKNKKLRNNNKFKSKSMPVKLEVESLKRNIARNANVKHTIQDPWFLNANKAREIEFNL